MKLGHLRYILWIALAGLIPFQSAWANDMNHLGNPNAATRGIGAGNGNGLNNGLNNNGLNQQQQQLTPAQQFQQFAAAQGGGGAGGAGGGGGASYRGVSEAAKESVKAGEKTREEIKGGLEKSNESIKSLTESFLSGAKDLQVPEATGAVEAVAAAQPDPQPTNIGADIVADIVAATQKLSETRVRTIQTIGQMFTAPAAQPPRQSNSGGSSTEERIASAGTSTRSPASTLGGTLLDHRNRGIGVSTQEPAIFRGVSSGSYNMPAGVQIPDVQIDSEE